MPDPSALPTGFAELDAGPTLRVRVWDLPTRIFHWALALAVVAQVATGLSGAMAWHFRIGYLSLALLHVAAIVFYVAVRRQQLVRPILSGDKLLSHEAPASQDGAASRLLALVVFALCGAFAFWISTLRL